MKAKKKNSPKFRFIFLPVSSEDQKNIRFEQNFVIGEDQKEKKKLFTKFSLCFFVNSSWGPTRISNKIKPTLLKKSWQTEPTLYGSIVYCLIKRLTITGLLGETYSAVLCMTMWLFCVCSDAEFSQKIEVINMQHFAKF